MIVGYADEIILSRTEKEDLMQLITLFEKGVREIEFVIADGPLVGFHAWVVNENHMRVGYPYAVAGNTSRILYDLYCHEIIRLCQKNFKLEDILRRIGEHGKVQEFLDILKTK